MIYTINIVTKTRPGDAYDQVALNPFPIIYIAADSKDLFQDSGLMRVLVKYIRNKPTYENATINIKSLTSDLTNVTTKSIKLSDIITIEQVNEINNA